MAQYNSGFSAQEPDQQYSMQQTTTTTVQQSGYQDYSADGQMNGGQQQSYGNSGYAFEPQYDTRGRSVSSQQQVDGSFDYRADQRRIEVGYDTGFHAGHQQHDQTDVELALPPKIISKEDFEARKSHRRKRGRQMSGGWRNAQRGEFTVEVQKESYDTTVEAVAPAPPMSEDEYRDWLTTNFKHLFDPFEDLGGMPTADFEKMVKASDLHRTQNLKGLFTKLDKDGNNRVSWNEFFTGMKYTKKDEVSRARKAFNSFVNSMTPVANKKLKKEKQDAADEGEPIPEESYLEAYNCRPPPLFIPIFYVIVWIFFIIYAVELEKGPEWNRVGWEKGFPFQSPLVFCPSVREQAWRFVSYSLLHDGYHHIVFNTLFSLLLGLPLETVHKAWRVGPVFMIGVLFGSLASSIIDPGTPLIGASGGVYALIGAHYALIVMNWEELQDDWTNIRANPLRFLLSGVARLIFLTVLVAIDFGLAFYRRYSGTTTLPTSAVAHIGGLLAGVFSGVPILRNIEKKPWEGVAFIVCLVITILMFLFGMFWNIFSTSYPEPNATPCSNPSLVGLRKR